MTISWSVNLCGFLPQRFRLFNEIGLTSLQEQEINPNIFTSNERENTWIVAKRNWLWLSEQETDYGCYLQDDFEFGSGMLLEVQRMIAEYPGCGISFFQAAGVTRDVFYRSEDHCLALGRGEIIWGGCLVLPRKFIKKMIFWGDQITSLTADDDKISAALNIMGVKCWSSGKNFALHYGAWLESTVISDNDIALTLNSEELKIRANMRSGRSRDFAQNNQMHYRAYNHKDIINFR